MPLPIPSPGTPSTPTHPGPVRVAPYYVRETQDWAIEQERMRHAQATYQVGEWAMFFLMWHMTDFYAGLVGRCHVCYQSTNTVLNRAASVYNQPTKNKCPDCFGTTLEGGYRAKIIRPAIFADTDEAEKLDRRGSIHPDDVSVESTWDFHSRSGDYLVRKDNSRWRLSEPRRNTLRTGFAFPQQATTSLNYNGMRAHYEESTTVAYTLPPTHREEVGNILSRPVRYPTDNFTDLSVYEDIRGPLIPPDLIGEDV